MRSGRRERRAGGRVTGVAATALVLALAGCACALGWMADGRGELTGAPAASARLLAVPPTSRPFRPQLVFAVADVVAEPVRLVPTEPPRRATALPCLPDRGTLDVLLLDVLGREIAFGPFDQLRLEPAVEWADEPKIWFASAGQSGHIVVPGLRPGRYFGTLTSEKAGSQTRTEILVSAGEPTGLVLRR